MVGSAFSLMEKEVANCCFLLFGVNIKKKQKNKKPDTQESKMFNWNELILPESGRVMLASLYCTNVNCLKTIV